ncbi:MAG: trypsin [Ignavibacteriae bacterium HGW-Ignavibacteriae-1]|nr:MAG: trypsin [Ignavibacteriae bacterium HGW-Ignavibacteriae-1]
MKFLILTIAFLVSLSYVSAQRSFVEAGVKGESPYFELPPDINIEHFPLLSTKADVTISGMMADVTITQSYVNRGEKAIEAVYVFPASTRAAVYAMEMKIADRTIKAVIQPKAKAREMYEEAKEEGKSASLLEQRRPNIFSMNVANVMPGDTIQVALRYTEMLIPEELEYEFVLPTVVGPRYISEKNDTDNPVENVGYIPSNVPTYDFDISITMNTIIPMDKLSSKSHKIEIQKLNDNQQIIKLAKGEEKSGNRDFILSFRPAGERIETGLLLHQGDKENYFMLVIQPPKRVEIKDVVPREFIFVVDVSGSMNGFPIDISKASMEQLLRRMRPNDLFNVILFASGTVLFSENSIAATDKNLMNAIEFINKEHGHGGTELMPALELALNMPNNEGYSKSIVVMTDGLVGVDKKAVNYIRDNLNKANLYSFGIGNSMNRFLIEAMALAGAGEPLIITGPEGAQKAADRFMKYIESPVLTDISIEFDGFATYDVEPIKPFDLTAERPIIVYGKYEGHPSGTIVLRGKTAKQDLHVNIPVDRFGKMDQSNAIKYIYARNKLKLIEMYDNFGKNNYNYKNISTLSFEDAITEIGMKYKLLTEHTSFVAIDSEIRNESGEYDTVNQPLPVPEGMEGIGGIVIPAQINRGTVDVMSRASASGELNGGYPQTKGVVMSGKGFKVNGSGSYSDIENPIMPMYADDDESEYKYLQFPTSNLKFSFKNTSRIFDFKLGNILINGRLYTNDEGEYDKIEISEKNLIDEYLFSEIENIVKADYIKAIEGCDPYLVERALSYQFSLTIYLPNKFMIEYMDKTYEAENKNGHIFALLKDGSGEQVMIGNQAKIEVSYFDESDNLLKTHTYNDILGFGKVPDGISAIAHKLKRGSEKLISFTFMHNPTNIAPKEVLYEGHKIKYIVVKVL